MHLNSGIELYLKILNIHFPLFRKPLFRWYFAAENYA